MSNAAAHTRFLPLIFCALFLLLCFSVFHNSFAQESAVNDLLTPDLRAWVTEQDSQFVVGLEGSYRPYAFTEDGQILGMAGEYLRTIGERLGVTFTVREYQNFAQVLEGAQKREIDIVPFAIENTERAQYLNFSDTFFRIQDRVVMRDDNFDYDGLASLSGMRVGLIEGYVLERELIENTQQFEVVSFPNELMAIRALSISNVDALIVDLGVISYYVEQEGISNLRVVGDVVFDDAQTMASRNDWPELNQVLNVGLSAITPEEHAQIFRRWINLSDFNAESVNQLLNWLSVLLVLGILCAFASLAWVYSLKRQVARRTIALESELQERRKVEAENYRLATAVEQSAEYVLIINKEGIVEYSNLAFFRLSVASDVLGRPFVDLAKNEDKKILLTALSELKAGEVWRGKIFLDIPDADDIHVAMTITPIQGDTETDGYVATGRNISHEEALEQKLRHGEKLSALGTMAGGIAHDFNNLLVPILGFTDLLQKEVPLKSQGALDAINSAARRAQDLVQRILVFSRQNEGKKETIDLGIEVREGLTFLRSLLPATIEIRSKIASEKTILGDQTQIQQILLNLGTNASDAMVDERGILEIELDTYNVTIADATSLPDLELGKYCRILVKDDGSGMTADQQKHMFDPYYTSKPSGKGTGLGLASVHGTVKNHGGAIRVSSRVSAGTQIELFFPILPETKSKHKGVIPEQIPKGRGERVLLVDDDELVLDAVGYMLDSLGYQVTTKSCPLDALNTVKSSPDTFEAILTDLTMPNMTGAQLASEVRAVKPEIPVVLMTGKTDLLEESELTSIGKPFRVIELATKMHEAL